MRARFTTLLPIAAATALVIGGGDAKALTIRYSFTNPSVPAYTGGTIEVASLDQTLGTPVTFTVENGTTNIVTAPFSSSATDSTTLSYFGTSPDNSWLADNFGFGQSLSSTTPWRNLLGTFNSTGGVSGDFAWLNPTNSEIGINADAITFSLVPGPLPALGAAAAFGWSRRLRKRIQRSPLAAARD